MQADSTPCAPDIERSVLAAVLLEPELLDRAISKGITDASFYSAQNSTIWRTMKQITDAGGVIDLRIIAEALKPVSNIFQKNPIACLMDISESIATTAAFQSWLGILKKHEATRLVLKSAMAAGTDIRSGLPVLDVVRQLEDTAALARRKLDSKEYLKLGQHMKGIITEGLENPEQPIPCGIPGADGVLRMRKKKLHVLAAGSGIGKTGFCLNAMLGQARAGLTSVLFCGETSSQEITRRLLGICAEIPTFALEDLKQINSKQNIDIQRAAAELKNLESKIIILGKGDYKHSAKGIRTELKRLHDETGNALSAVYVDYLQNLRPDENMNRFGRVEQLESMVFNLNETFGELNICATLLCQLNRDRERIEKNKPPDVCDLKGCSAIEQEADYLTFLHRPHPDKSGRVAVQWYSRKVRGAVSVNCTLEYNTVTSTYNFQQHRYDESFNP